MRKKTNYESNYILESNVIDLAKAKKIIRNKKNNTKVKKNITINKNTNKNKNINKNINNTKIKQFNRHKTHDIFRTSIYKRILILTVILIFAAGTNFIWFKFEISENIFLTRFGTKSIGKVIGTEEEISLLQRGDRIEYRSIIEFETQNGENVKFKTDGYRHFDKYNKGIITVVYNTDDPKMAKVDSFDELIMPIIIFTVSGGAFLVFPIYLIYFDCLKKLKILNERIFI